MKKSSILGWIFVIAVIIAMLKMSSFMGGLGFILTIVIVIISIMFLGGGIYLLYMSYESLFSDGEVVTAIGYLVGAIIFFFIAIKIITWLISVLW